MKAFISHSWKDNAIIDRFIKPVLSGFFENVTILDKINSEADNIPYNKQVRIAIDNCDLFIIVVSENSNDTSKTDQILNELLMARKRRKSVLIITIDNAEYSDLEPQLIGYSSVQLNSSLTGIANDEQINSFKRTIVLFVDRINNKIPEILIRKEVVRYDLPDETGDIPRREQRFPFHFSQRLLIRIGLPLIIIVTCSLLYFFPGIWSILIRSNAYEDSTFISIDKSPIIDATGGDSALDSISGRVYINNFQNYSIVIYAKTNLWYVQPYETDNIQPLADDGKWRSITHLGSEYCILLVTKNFLPTSPIATFPWSIKGVIKYKLIK